MGTHIIKMPDIGEGIAEVELVEWHVQPGDSVVEDQLLADVMTDKATVQVPSPVHGKVLALGGKVGEVMAVGSELIRLEVEGEGNEGKASAARAPAEPEVGQVQAVAAPTADEETRADTDVAGNSASGAAARAGAGPHGDARAEAASGSGQACAGRPARPEGEKPLASPAVRKRAWDLGIELQYVPGTGAAGQITHADLDAYAARGSAAAASATRAIAYAQRDGERQIPVIGLRRKIAEKMQESKRRIPHFTYVEEVDVTELEALRGRLNAQWGAQRGKLTILPLLARAMVLALRDYPQINARYDDEAGIVTRYDAVHLGIAAQTEAGLMVPVVRHAEALDIWACAIEVARLADAARAGSATRDELGGSTITLTSLGALGGIVSTPVINHPEVAIVGVNRIVERPMIVGGAVVARKMMNLSSSFDHRVVDGMHAAEFIQRIRSLLECPALLFVE
ncbi:dihydrolipoamide acetyltransferase family protein [Pollutimonas sp. H1-120]|uniref:dihydrolipoamide acetyltransferase family protein n=1 Tax=Pollutimonas sp. H1-120 TaxID=3148824 RepID=UPI003B5278A6